MCKVSAQKYPVLLGMANISSNTKYKRNKVNRIYRITGKITEPGVQSCLAKLTMSGLIGGGCVVSNLTGVRGQRE